MIIYKWKTIGNLILNYNKNIVKIKNYNNFKTKIYRFKNFKRNQMFEDQNIAFLRKVKKKTFTNKSLLESYEIIKLINKIKLK